MTTEAAQPIATTTPAGFCPKCHYPLNLGTCPECGTEVSPDSILTSLSQTRAAKTRRWIIRTILFLILPAAAIYGAWHIPWPRFMPTSWLLSFQPDANRWANVDIFDLTIRDKVKKTADHWATGELLRRFVRGQLSTAQSSRFIDKMLLLQFAIRPKTPVGISLPYRVSACQLIPTSSRTALGTTVQFRSLVDGREWAISGSIFASGALGQTSTGSSIQFTSTPGRHEIEFSITAVATETTTPLDSPTVILRRSLKRVVEVVDTPPGELVHCQCDTESLRSLQASLAVRFSGSYVNGGLSIRPSGRLKTPVAGRIFARPAGQGDFVEYGRLVLIDWRSTNYLTGLTGAPSVDIRIQPDPKVAIEEIPGEIPEIFGCPLEWHGIKNDSIHTATSNPTDGTIGN